MLTHFAGDSTAERVAMYHVNQLGWPGIGYHYVVNKDGSIEQTNYLTTVSYHVGNYNTRSIGIALNGNFQTIYPTQAQQDAARWLVNHVRRLARLYIVRTVGHRELGIATACPGNTYRQWLPYVVSEMEVEPVPEPEPDVLAALVQRVDKMEEWLVGQGYSL